MSAPTLVAEGVCDLSATGWQSYGKAADTPMLPASTVKLMTLYVARKYVPDADLTDTVTFISADMSGGSVAGLQVDDVITYGDLFHGLILPSGNDAAKCIARNVGERIKIARGVSGTSIGVFNNEMNRIAAADFPHWVGANFASPSGDDLNSRLTPRQLCEVAFALDPYSVGVAGALTWDMAITGPNARIQTVTHTVDPAGPVAFPEMVAAKTGTGAYSTYNVVMVWDDALGNRRATSIIKSSSTLQRMADLRAAMDYAATLEPPPPVPITPGPGGTPVAYRVGIGGGTHDVTAVKAGVGGRTVTVWP